MSRKPQLPADAVDRIEDFVESLFDVVRRDAEACAKTIIAIPDIPHEAVSALNRFLLNLQLAQAAGARIMNELRAPASRPLN